MFLIQAVRTSVAEQTDQPMVFGHHYKHVANLRLTIQLLVYDKRYMLIFTTHIVKATQITELIQTGDA